ncbi:MAG: porin family protein [Syntrophaceae bacterium]|nr:porin family protein [Syntrophaceae bacterium]
MKKIFYVVFVVLMVLSFSVLAQAQSNTKGIYVGLVGGYVIPTMDGNLVAGGTPVAYDYDLDLKNGYLVGAKVGWLTPFSNRALAVEFEYNHIENKMDSWDNFIMTGLDAETDGKVKIDSFMFNLLARYPTGRFHPYIGAGAGCAFVKISDMDHTYMGSFVALITGGSDTVFAYQVMAGLDFDITQNIIIGMSYKYFVLDKISFDNNVIGLWDGPGRPELDYKAHNIMLSLSYMF